MRHGLPVADAAKPLALRAPRLLRAGRHARAAVVGRSGSEERGKGHAAVSRAGFHAPRCTCGLVPHLGGATSMPPVRAPCSARAAAGGGHAAMEKGVLRLVK